jgi:hypothetical protein
LWEQARRLSNFLRTPLRHSLKQEATIMETETQIVLLFLGAGLLAYVIIPGLLVIWDRVLD